MAKKNYPLEIILRHTGTVELVDSEDNTLWSSDDDADFKETISQEFLTEDDIDDVLAYLEDAEILTSEECARFEGDEWDVMEESLADDDEEDDNERPEEDEDDEND